MEVKMKVEIINPEIVENLYHNHGVFACTCYNTPEKYAAKVGKSCEQDGHMSGSRCEYIKFKISDLDRGTAEQALRHEIGTEIPYEFQDNYSFADFSDLIKDVSPDQIKMVLIGKHHKPYKIVIRLKIYTII